MLDSGFMPLVIWGGDRISKVLDVRLLLGRKRQSFVHRAIVLFTLHTLLNAIIYFLQLNTGGGSDDNTKVDY